jgi:hypothetical protein
MRFGGRQHWLPSTWRRFSARGVWTYNLHGEKARTALGCRRDRPRGRSPSFDRAYVCFRCAIYGSEHHALNGDPVGRLRVEIVQLAVGQDCHVVAVDIVRNVLIVIELHSNAGCDTGGRRWTI